MAFMGDFGASNTLYGLLRRIMRGGGGRNGRRRLDLPGARHRRARRSRRVLPCMRGSEEADDRGDEGEEEREPRENGEENHCALIIEISRSSR